MPELKHIADTLDVAMLTVMQEIQRIVGESYLFTSDGHVLKIAEAMGLQVLDPEKMTLEDIPPSLNRRFAKREKLRVRIICYDCEGSNCLDLERTVDNICCNGTCVSLGKKIEIGTVIIVKLKKRGQ